MYNAESGQSLILNCQSSHDTLWFHNSLNKQPISSSNDLVIASISLDNSGYYYCYGSYKTNKAHFLAQTMVQYYSKSNFLQNDQYIIIISNNNYSNSTFFHFNYFS